MIKPIFDPFSDEREKMVREHMMARGITSKEVLEAFLNVPRELFVPEEFVELAYEDRPLPTLEGQTISQPYIMALMTELLQLPKEPNVKVLEVGAGSGYQAAILAYMGVEVVSIELLPAVAKFARENLAKLTFTDKVKIIEGDGCLGFPEEAPYDGIMVTAAAPKIPPALLEQLKIGGKLVIPIGNLLIQELLQVVKNSENDITINKTIGCRFVPLLGKDGFKV